MNKYYLLSQWLMDCEEDYIKLTFTEVENIIGASLPNSAYKYRAWWANGGHIQANAWIEAQRRVSNVVLGQYVEFIRETNNRTTNMKLDLMKIFDGYIKNYHTLNLTIHHGSHSFTMTEIEYFSRLGSMLGYCPFTEDNCRGINRPMDLTWWDGEDADSWNDFILHLERENSFGKDLETLEKLFMESELVPYNVIGIMNVKNHERIEQLLGAAKVMCKVENALLIFRTNSKENTKGYFDEVHAYLLRTDQILNTKFAYVSEVAGTFFMHANKEEIIQRPQILK
jgi:hypothetical protein